MNYEDRVKISFDDFGWFSAAPVESDAGENFLYGLANEFGLGLTQDKEDCDIDYERAAEFYKRAADKGDGRAQFRLGVLYALGRGVEHSEELARDCFDECEKTVKPCVISAIAEMYFLGRGMAKDENKAKSLWEKAVGLGCPNAKAFMERYLGIEYEKLAATEPDELLKLAEAGNVEAQFRYGDSFSGKRGKKNGALAYEWLKRAAEEGHARALYKLSGFISSGGYIACVPYICCLMDIFATAFGCVNAPAYVAHHYKWGWGVVQSDEMNVEYIELSAAMGDPEGKCKLGVLYGYGEEYAKVPYAIDLYRAVTLLKEALDAGVSDARYPYNKFVKMLTPEQKSMLSIGDKK